MLICKAKKNLDRRVDNHLAPHYQGPWTGFEGSTKPNLKNNTCARSSLAFRTPLTENWKLKIIIFSITAYFFSLKFVFAFLSTNSHPLLLLRRYPDIHPGWFQEIYQNPIIFKVRFLLHLSPMDFLGFYWQTVCRKNENPVYVSALDLIFSARNCDMLGRLIPFSVGISTWILISGGTLIFWLWLSRFSLSFLLFGLISFMFIYFSVEA